jgi:AcrR family transcriptional regulator
MSENDADVPAAVRAEIADAVRAALAEHGYARLTTAKIAAESEKSEAGLYYYYDSKDEMVAAFLEETSDYLASALGDVAAPNAEARLRAACDHLFVDREDESRRCVNVAIMELLSHAPYSETLREPLRTLERDTHAFLADVIAAGIADGSFRSDVDPGATAALLLAAADGSTGFYLALGMEDVGESLDGAVDAYVDSLLAA